jgi:DNA-binding transcriptional LysR family regulator
MDDVEVRELRYFIAVAQELNFTRAAERLGIAQPPLSAAIAKLERKLGVPLLERTSRRVALTEAGAVLLEQGWIAVEGFGAAIERARRKGSQADRLTLAVKSGGGTVLLRRITQRCAQDPQMPEVHILFGHYGEQAAALRNGTADVALLRTPFDPRGLDTEVLMVEPRVVALAADHRLAGRRELRRADLAGEPMPRWEPYDETIAAHWAGWVRNSTVWDRVAGVAGTDDGHDGDRTVAAEPGAAAVSTAAGAGASTASPNAATAEGPRVTDINQLLDAVALGQTIAFLPRSAAHQYNRADLVFLPVVDLSPSTLVAAWPDVSRSRTVASFVRTAVDAAQELSDQAAAFA